MSIPHNSDFHHGLLTPIVGFLVFSQRLPIDTPPYDLLMTSLLLAYGFIALGVSGRLWFNQVFRAPWEQSDDREPSSLPYSSG